MDLSKQTAFLLRISLFSAGKEVFREHYRIQEERSQMKEWKAKERRDKKRLHQKYKTSKGQSQKTEQLLNLNAREP